MGNVIDLASVDGPVVDDLSGDFIQLDMMEQNNITNAMFNALKSLDIPNSSLVAHQDDNGTISLRNEMRTYEDGNGGATFDSGLQIDNAQSHTIGAWVRIEELENGNYNVNLAVNHSGSFEQNTRDERRTVMNYEVDAENGEIVSRDGHAIAHDDAANQWTIDAAQTIEHSFVQNLGTTAQESIAQYRPESAATSVGEPPIDAKLNSLSELAAAAANSGEPDRPVQEVNSVAPN